MTELNARTIALFLMTLGGVAAGCTADTTDTGTGDEEDLTSVTARERKMTFDGYVYVDVGTSDSVILTMVNRQTKSVFGAIRTAEISANTRELALEDAATFKKEKVTVVDPSNPSAKKDMTRVRYRYTDRALVPIAMASRGATSLALLNGNYQNQSKRVLKECTDNTAHDQEFESAIWYVFNPSLDQCRTAIETEQTAIDTDRKALSDQATQVTTSEVARLYIPTTIQFESTKTSTKKTYPEYDRLWSGGVKPGRVVVSMVSGVMADWAANEKPETIKDVGYTMYFQQQAELLKVHPKLAVADAEGADLTTFTVGTKTVTGATWSDLSHWELDGTGWPANITTAADRLALRKAVAAKLVRRWLRWEEPVSVKIGSAAAKDVTIEINTYYGAETDETPHRRALSGSDVVIYNGHSYIGSGPLDPNRYESSDFPSSYQLFFFNSCVSFNYYEKDFFAMHDGGTKNLEMVTNGLESWVNGSGPSVGRFVANLLDGKQHSYKDLLIATANGAPSTDVGQDALRVVDGEVDNKYAPSKTKIVVSPK